MFNINDNGLRGAWEFEFPIQEVLTAANKKLSLHTERKAFWDKEYKATEDKIKEKGFEFTDTTTSTCAGTVRFSADRELIDKLSKCKEKQNKHEKASTEFQTWIKALDGKFKRNQSATMMLRYSDIEYFGL